MEPRTIETPPQLPVATVTQEPQPRRTPSPSSRRDCIRLRGLPYESHGGTVVRFLGEYARHIVHQGVHIIYKSDGKPSGDAFVQMDSEGSAALTAACCHRRYIRGWRKLRYVEVYQCSMDDIKKLGAVPVTTAMLLPPLVGSLHPCGVPFVPVLPLVASTMVFPPITYLPYSSLLVSPTPPEDGRQRGAPARPTVRRHATQ